MKKVLVFLSFILFFNSNAQLGFSHEIGVFVAGVNFQSDFGVRNDMESNIGNTGIGLGIFHYINFSYRVDCSCYTRDNYWNDHFRIRNEISWNTTKLDHLGKWIDKTNETYTFDDDQLINMDAKATVLDIGTQIEYYPFSIRDFMAMGRKFGPFVAAGFRYNSYSPNLTSGLPGGIENVDNIFPAFLGGVSNESSATWSTVWSAGTRYKLTELSDLFVELRWQYYFSDKVDGLFHDSNANKYNDWNVWFNFGYIIYLE